MFGLPQLNPVLHFLRLRVHSNEVRLAPTSSSVLVLDYRSNPFCSVDSLLVCRAIWESITEAFNSVVDSLSCALVSDLSSAWCDL